MQLTSPTPKRHRISLTPLIDVVFILLIFFMLASSFQQWSQIELGLHTTVIDENDKDLPDFVTVKLKADALYQIEDQELTLNAVVNRLKKRVAEQPNTQILLQPVSDINAQAIVNALTALKQHGLTTVALTR